MTHLKLFKKHAALSYRPEIDGLRAVAVASVILYHAQFVVFGKDWFQGGFIGVDIFFVISGYLISRIIFNELQTQGSFSFLMFYERRARRILPMLLLVIFVSFPFAWRVLLPSDFVEYVESIVASLLFGSNFFFYFTTTEYGADSSLLKPFLHTWSLGVEEQFYLVFPVIAIVAFKYCRNSTVTALVVLGLISLSFAEFMQARNSDLNFYLPFSRFWELLVGSVLAYRELNFRSSTGGIGKRVLPTVGMCLVVWSIFVFDGETPHPGVFTLIPIAGVALIIGFCSKEDLIGRLLATKPFVALGLISYSAYLWHFPIFAFSRLGGNISGYDKLGLVALTLCMSVASYIFVEKFFRSVASISTRSFVKFLGGSTSLIIVMATIVIVNDGFESRFPRVVGFENYEADNRKLRDEKIKKSPRGRDSFHSVDKKVLIVGNSHAGDFYRALIQQYPLSDGLDFLRFDAQIHCADERISEFAGERDQIYNSPQYMNASTVIIASRYKHRWTCIRERSSIVQKDIDGLKFLINRAQSDGKHVIVVGSRAEFSRIGGKTVADHIYQSHKDDADLLSNMPQILRDAAKLNYLNLKGDDELSDSVEAVAENSGAAYFDIAPLACDMSEEVCPTYTADGFKIYHDSHHLTWEGSRYFGQQLARVGFEKLIK